MDYCRNDTIGLAGLCKLARTEEVATQLRPCSFSVHHPRGGIQYSCFPRASLPSKPENTIGRGFVDPEFDGPQNFGARSLGTCFTLQRFTEDLSVISGVQ